MQLDGCFCELLESVQRVVFRELALIDEPCDADGELAYVGCCRSCRCCKLIGLCMCLQGNCRCFLNRTICSWQRPCHMVCNV